MEKLTELISGDLKRWANTTKWSIEGLIIAWKEEKSLRQWAIVNALSWVAIYFFGFAPS